jgi:uracil-DNA glycosylase family 4
MTDCPIPGKVIHSYGNLIDPTYMVIGGVPVEIDLLEDQPFSGEAGKILREAMGKCGLTKTNAVITNTIPCIPDKEQFRIDSNLVNLCVDWWILSEIERLKPQFLLLVGTTATKHLLGHHDEISLLRNQLFKTLLPKPPRGLDSFDDRYNMCFKAIKVTFHPAYIFGLGNSEYGKHLKDCFEDDVRKFRNLIDNPSIF